MKPSLQIGSIKSLFVRLLCTHRFHNITKALLKQDCQKPNTSTYEFQKDFYWPCEHEQPCNGELCALPQCHPNITPLEDGDRPCNSASNEYRRCLTQASVAKSTNYHRHVRLQALSNEFSAQRHRSALCSVHGPLRGHLKMHTTTCMPHATTPPHHHMPPHHQTLIISRDHTSALQLCMTCS